MAKQGLEKVVKQVEPVVSEVMHKFLGVSIDELNKDISAKLRKSPLTDVPIDISIPFKEAKRNFKRTYLRRLLRINYGNISEVARQARIDRRSIHRIIKDAMMDVARIREEMIKPYDVKQRVIEHVIEDVLDSYKNIIHPSKLKEVYGQVPELSKDILEGVPVESKSLKEAEKEFEREYLRKALVAYNYNLKETAEKIRIRYETLLRKIKRLGL
ncbi:MAG: helix-turn-helix domain-containing protein [Candidatus Nanoarchaeia archaeon]